jgi:hypothetical protein
MSETTKALIGLDLAMGIPLPKVAVQHRAR